MWEVNLDIEALIAPLDEDNPSGEDMEYELDFGELTRAAQGVEGQQIDDKNVIDAVPPDWKKVKELSLQLFERTRDLRVAVHLTHALLDLEGFSGLRDGLTLVKGLSESLWESVHPQLDEDDGDPVFRCNALTELANVDGLGASVLAAPLVDSKAVGKYSLRSVKTVEGALSHVGDESAPSKAVIEAAFSDVDASSVTETAGLVDECVTLIEEIQAFYDTQVGVGASPSLTQGSERVNKLGTFALLSDAQKFLHRQLQRLGLGDAEEAIVEQDDDSGDSAAVSGVSTTAIEVSGDIRSRK